MPPPPSLPQGVIPPTGHAVPPSTQAEAHGSVWTEGPMGTGGLQETPGICVPQGTTPPAEQAIHTHSSGAGPALGVPGAAAKVGKGSGTPSGPLVSGLWTMKTQRNDHSSSGPGR